MDAAQVRGWSEDEIARAESVVGFRFPAYYREFLRALGRDGGGLMLGTHIYPRDVDEFPRWRKLANRLMKQSAAEETLPDNALVFGDHQGYQFWYLVVDPAAEDPPVFYYHEGRKRPQQFSSSFTQFLLEVVEESRRDKQWLEEQRARRNAARTALDSRRDTGEGKEPGPGT